MDPRALFRPALAAFVLSIVLSGMLSGTSAWAQKYTVDPDGNLVRHTRLEEACAAALERFCPDALPRQTRNQATCLKPYRTSLQPYCRSAVTAALK